MTADLSMRQASGECFNALLNLREIAGLTPPMLRACQNCYLAMHASRSLDPVKVPLLATSFTLVVLSRSSSSSSSYSLLTSLSTWYGGGPVK